LFSLLVALQILLVALQVLLVELQILLVALQILHFALNILGSTRVGGDFARTGWVIRPLYMCVCGKPIAICKFYIYTRLSLCLIFMLFS
jgi:hypothetical protein